MLIRNRVLLSTRRLIFLLLLICAVGYLHISSFASSKDSKDTKEETDPIFNNHNSDLINYICDHLLISPSSILDFELFLYDLQEARLGGLKKEFVIGRGLDNMACAYCSLEGFLTSSNLEDEQNIRVIALFDNEEIGSGSLMGAESTFLGDLIQNIHSTADEERIARRKSMILSCVGTECNSHT